MIWGFALPEANTVEIWVSRKCQVNQENKWEYIYELHASYTVPAILQTSQESRAIAKKFYKKIFEGEFANKPIIWFNQFQDVLWLRYSDTLTHLCTLRGFKVLSFYTAVNPPVFDAPVVNVRRLQFSEAWNSFLQPHMKQILVAFGKPELLIRHKPSSGQRVWDAPFHLLEMQIKKWGTGDDDADADYKPEVHFLTKFQLQKLIKKIDHPTRCTKSKVPKPIQSSTRRSDRFIEKPLNYYEGGEEADDDEYSGNEGVGEAEDNGNEDNSGNNEG